MSKALKNDIFRLLDYLWDDESEHYQANPKRNHIFIVMKKLAQRVGYQKSQL